MSACRLQSKHLSMGGVKTQMYSAPGVFPVAQRKKGNFHQTQAMY